MTPRKVDPYVYVMEWIWRHSQATGPLRYILLRIGRVMKWTPYGFETGPLPIEEIARDVDMVDSTVRQHIKALGALDGDLEIVRSRRRGETYRYRLRREQRLPLPDIQPATHRRMAAVSPPESDGEPPPEFSGDTAEIQRSERRNSAVSAPAVGGGVSGDTFFSEVVRTSVPTTSLEDQAAAGFLEWFCATYQIKLGCAYEVKREPALRVIGELLHGRSVERLQSMARVMFDAERDTFITDSDYSIYVLKHKATYIERVVVINERRAREHVS